MTFATGSLNCDIVLWAVNRITMSRIATCVMHRDTVTVEKCHYPNFCLALFKTTHLGTPAIQTGSAASNNEIC